MKNKRMIYFVSAAIISTSVISCDDQKTENSNRTSVVKVTTQEAGAAETNKLLTYSGSLEAMNTVQVGFAVPGVVNQVAVQEGQHVKKGQLLASIDDTEFANALLIANAGFSQAEDMYKRMEELYKKGSLPEKDYIDIQSKLAQAKANKNISAKRISDSRLHAPLTGVISSRQAEIGSTAAPGMPAFVIVKTDELYAKIAVPESEIGTLKNGMKAEIFIPTLNETVTGKVVIINPQADPVSKSYAVKLIVNNTAGKLLPGMITNVYVNTGEKVETITLPATAITRDTDGVNYVFVVNSKNKAIRKRVKLGTVTGNNNVEILEGITRGENVVTAGVSKLKDGTTVSL